MEDITVKQGHLSKAMKEFNFVERYELDNYSNVHEPLVVFGVYHPEDIEVIRSHEDKVIIWWMGVDSWNIKNATLFQRPNVVNVSSMNNIVSLLRSKNITCHLARPTRLAGDQKPIIKGNKVYAYVNHRKPDYFRKSLIESLNVPFKVLIADFNFSQADWYAGINDEYFSQCFVGLALSDYAGGGSGITECGLKGLKCITNLMNLPNVINWETKEDIESAIIAESEKIGTIDNELSEIVYNCVYPDNKEFNLFNILN